MNNNYFEPVQTSYFEPEEVGDIADKNNEWIYAPVKQTDEQGFRLPEKDIAKPVLNEEALELQQKESVVKQVANFLFETSKVAADPVIGVAETVAYGATATVNKVTEGYGRALYPVAKALHEVMYNESFPYTEDQYAEATHYLPEQPQSNTGKLVAEGIGKVFEKYEEGVDAYTSSQEELSSGPFLPVAQGTALKSLPWLLGVAGIAKGGPAVIDAASKRPPADPVLKTYKEPVLDPLPVELERPAPFIEKEISPGVSTWVKEIWTGRQHTTETKKASRGNTPSESERLKEKQALYKLHKETGAPDDIVAHNILKTQEKANELGEPVLVYQSASGNIGTVPKSFGKSPFVNGKLIATIWPETLGEVSVPSTVQAGGQHIGKYEGVIDRNKNEIVIRTQEITSDFQGKGLGTKALKEVVDYAMDNKLVVKSDASLTAGANKTWEKLSSEYIVEKNPDAITDSKGVTRSEAVGIPVYKVYERQLRGDEVPGPIVDYGKIYDQAKSEDAYRTVTKGIDIPEKDLPRNRSQLFVDERPFWQMEPDLFTVKQTKETKFGTGATDITLREYTATFPDLPPRYGKGGQFIPFRGQYISPRSVGIVKRNPIVNWTVSQIERERLWLQQEFHEIMNGSDVIIKFGKPTWVPTKRGWRTQLESLPLDQQVKVIELRDLYDEPGRVGKPERTVLEAQGLTPESIDFFYKDWDTIHKPAAGRNSIAKELNKTGKNIPEFEMHDGYSPHIWEGDFRVFVKNKAGEVIRTGAADNIVSAKLLQKKLKEQYGEKYKVDYYAREGKTNDLTVDAINDLIVKVKEKFPEESAELAAFLESQKDIRGVNVHGLQRKGARGFLGDPKTQHNTNKLVEEFVKSREIFVQGMLRSQSALRLKYNMDLLKERPHLKRLYPNSIEYSAKAVDYYLGHKTLADEVISRYTAAIAGETGVKRAVEKLSSTMTYPVLLVHSVPNIAVQPFQIGYGNIKAVALRNELGLNTADVHVSFAKGLVDMTTKKTPELRELSIEAGKRGAVAPEFIQSMFESETVRGDALKHTKWYKDLASGKLSYAVPDEYSRLAQVFGFYNVLRKGGRDHQTAMYDSIELSKHYSTQYNAAERPAAYRGTTGQVIGKFSTWSSNQYAQMLEYWDVAKHGDITPLAHYMTYSALIAGVYGLWGVAESDFLVEQVNKRTGSNYPLPSMVIAETMPDVLAYGPIQSSLDYTTGTTDLPNFNRRLTSFPLIDFYGEVLGSNGKLISKYLGMGAPPTKIDMERALVSFAPRSMHSYIKAYIDNGTIYLPEKGQSYLQHDPKTGKGTYRIDRDTQIVNYFGGKTTEQHKISLINRWIQTVEANRKLTVTDWAKYVAIARSMNTPINLDAFSEQIALDYRVTPKEFMDAVRTQAKTFNTAIEERMLDVKSKKGRRAGANYYEQLEHDSYGDYFE